MQVNEERTERAMQRVPASWGRWMAWFGFCHFSAVVWAITGFLIIKGL